jgi:NADH dehydrogenase
MKNIIIVGGGAGGLELAVGLAKKKNKETKITLIDKEKTHIWKPHLHEVASYLV